MSIINEFQDHVNGFKKSELSKEQALANWALGLSGETGETVDIIKKHLFHSKDLDITAIKKELGDVFWYLFALTSELDLTVEDILQTNIDKLQKRHNGTSFNIDVANVNKELESQLGDPIAKQNGINSRFVTVTYGLGDK